MNPESIPLHGRGYDGYPDQPGGARVIQNTTVNIVIDPPPKDHIICSLCCFFYYNPLCLGLVALIYSIKARDRKVVGDFEGAHTYGSTARCLNILSTFLFVLAVALLIYVIYAAVTANERFININYHYNSYDNVFRNSFNNRYG